MLGGFSRKTSCLLLAKTLKARILLWQINYFHFWIMFQFLRQQCCNIRFVGFLVHARKRGSMAGHGKPFHLTWNVSGISNVKFCLNGRCPRYLFSYSDQTGLL